MARFTYAQAIEHVAKARDEWEGRPLTGRSTRLIRRGESVAVRYHATDVVTINPDGTYTLDSGEYRTMTTKARINEYAPVNVYQSKGVWYIGPSYAAWLAAGQPGGEYWKWADGQRVMFTDGMTVDAQGAPLSAEPEPDPHGMTYAQAFEYIGKLSNAYARNFAKAGAKARDVPAPSWVGTDAEPNEWPCAQTIDGLLYWLVSGEPNQDILQCAVARRGDQWFCYRMVEGDFASGRASEMAVIDIRHWLKQRRHILACELSGQPVDAAQFAEYFGGAM